MNRLKLYKVLLAAFALVVAGVVYVYAFADEAPDEKEVLSVSQIAETDTEPSEGISSENDDISSGDAEPETVCVHVCGCVVNSGIYYLELGSRVYDAIVAAGGFSEDAAESYLNLAAVATDGMQIYVPSESEDESSSVGVIPPATQDDGLIDINTADADKLTELPGIGDIKAAAIVSYRENNGSFSSVEEIMNVSGIGESSFERIKDLIKV